MISARYHTGRDEKLQILRAGERLVERDRGRAWRFVIRARNPP